MDNKFFAKLGKYILGLVLTVSLGLIAREYLFSIYLVPTSSMSPTLMPNDFILTTHYWPDTHRKIKRGGVYVFHSIQTKIYLQNCEGDSNEVLVKRIVAIPDDMILIHNGTFFVNKMQAIAFTIDDNCITKGTVGKLDIDIYPHDTLLFKWSLRNFGPLKVPAKGKRITLNRKKITLFREAIVAENPSILLKLDSNVQNDSYSNQEYTFKKDYFFMAGDNVFVSYDSRYWGFLPEENIIGKVVLVLFSFDPDEPWYKGFKWERFLKRVK